MSRALELGAIGWLVAGSYGCSSEGGADPAASGGTSGLEPANTGGAPSSGSAGASSSGAAGDSAGAPSAGAPASGLGTWGRWEGENPDGTTVSFTVGAQGTTVTDFTVTYESQCGTRTRSVPGPIPIEDMGFDWQTALPPGELVAGSGELVGGFVSQTQAEGSYRFQGVIAESSTSVCVRIVGTQCAEWEVLDQSSCSTGGEGTWTAAPVCVAEVEAPAELLGPRLAIILDQSGSMGDSVEPNANQRWIPVSEGVLDFVAEPGRSLRASLHLFPASSDALIACQADYAVPAVPMSALPDRDAFASALGAAVPEGGTPTLSAVLGAHEYLLDEQRASDSVASALVLITDGEPLVLDPDTMASMDDCAPPGVPVQNTIADVTEVARAAYDACPSIPTYVIGIGESTDTLSAISHGGGTAFFSVSLGDPATTRAELTDVLRTIAAQL